MSLLERISGRGARLTGVVEQLRKQLADAEHELERLSIAEEVISGLNVETEAAQKMSAPASAGSPVPGARLIPYRTETTDRTETTGVADLPDDYRALAEAVTGAKTPVRCKTVCEQLGLPVTSEAVEGTRAKLKRLVERGWLRMDASGAAAVDRAGSGRRGGADLGGDAEGGHALVAGADGQPHRPVAVDDRADLAAV